MLRHARDGFNFDASPPVILEAHDVSVRRGTRVVLTDVSVTAAAGEIVGLVGANGCGKSTLLACIAGVLEPREGRILVDGGSVWGPQRDRTRARSALGYVPEGADPPGFLTARELWALGRSGDGFNLTNFARLKCTTSHEMRGTVSTSLRAEP